MPLSQCLQQYVSLSVREGGGAPVTCPDPTCQAMQGLSDSEVPRQPVWLINMQIEREIVARDVPLSLYLSRYLSSAHTHTHLYLVMQTLYVN